MPKGNQPKWIVEACQVLRSKVLYRDAGFGPPGNECTMRIRDETELFVKSWIVPILDALETGNFRMCQYICSGERRTQIGFERCPECGDEREKRSECKSCNGTGQLSRLET